MKDIILFVLGVVLVLLVIDFFVLMTWIYTNQMPIGNIWVGRISYEFIRFILA